MQTRRYRVVSLGPGGEALSIVFLDRAVTTEDLAEGVGQRAVAEATAWLAAAPDRGDCIRA